MKNRISIINGTVISGGRTTAANVLLENGKISYVGPEVPAVDEQTEVIDAQGKWVSAGFIDLHTHGAGGADFMDGTVEAYEAALVKHAEHGTTLLYPTTLSSTTESL